MSHLRRCHDVGPSNEQMQALIFIDLNLLAAMQVCSPEGLAKIYTDAWPRFADLGGILQQVRRGFLINDSTCTLPVQLSHDVLYSQHFHTSVSDTALPCSCMYLAGPVSPHGVTSLLLRDTFRRILNL